MAFGPLKRYDVDGSFCQPKITISFLSTYPLRRYPLWLEKDSLSVWFVELGQEGCIRHAGARASMR
eukprot:6071136-Amphidinium_carterae.1